MLHEGYAPEEVSDIMQVSVATIYNWRKRWDEAGTAGLLPRPKPGRPASATPEYWQVVEQALERDPTELGYTFTIWTLERLRDHVEQQTGIHLNATYLGSLMKAHGYVYRRPKHDLSIHQDADARDAAAAQLEALKKKPNKVISHFSLWTKQP
jgi:transposase